MDDIGHDAPEREIVIDRDENRLMRGVLGTQLDPAFFLDQALEGELAMQGGDDDPPIALFDRAIDDQQIPVVDPGPDHRVAGGADKVGGRGVQDQVLVEVDALLDMIVGGRGEAGGDSHAEEGELCRLADLQAINGGNRAVGGEGAVAGHGPFKRGWPARDREPICRPG